MTFKKTIKSVESRLFPNGVKPGDIAANMTPFNMALCYKIHSINSRQNWCDISFTNSERNVWKQNYHLLKKFGFSEIYAAEKDEISFIHQTNFEIGDDNYWLCILLTGLHERFNALKTLAQLGGARQSAAEKKFFNSLYAPGAAIDIGLSDRILNAALKSDNVK